jgi:hypothetical protein
MENNIIRSYPLIKSNINLIQYPIRTNIEDVNNIKELLRNKEFNKNYIKWKSGINYESKSNNKITIGGKLHMKLGKKFTFKHILNYKKNIENTIQYFYTYEYIKFDNINKINWDLYNLETNQIYNEIDNENIVIHEKNKEIYEYNNNVNKTIENINALEPVASI